MHGTPTEAATVLAVGVLMFMAGFHNMDNGQNIRWIEEKIGVEMFDSNLLGVPYTPVMAYMSGALLLFVGLFMTSLGAWLLGRLR